MIANKETRNTNPNYLISRLGKAIFMLGVSLMLTVSIFAQVPDGTPTDGGSDDGAGDPDAPFDGGISLLVAAGVAYGAKQWKDARKVSKEQEANAE